MLLALARSAARAEAELAGWIGRLRDLGADWQATADAAGMSAEAARQRFETGFQAGPADTGLCRGGVLPVRHRTYFRRLAGMRSAGTRPLGSGSFLSWVSTQRRAGPRGRDPER
jgi:hypothetical protein